MAAGGGLQGVQLRKTAGPSVSVDTAVALKEGLAAEKAANKRLRDVDMEAWYTELELHTFPTIFVPITPADGRAMAAGYWQKKDQQKPLTAEDQALLAALEGKIAAALEGFGAGSEG
jgi:hypothetical protein